MNEQDTHPKSADTDEVADLEMDEAAAASVAGGKTVVTPHLPPPPAPTPVPMPYPN